MRRIAQKSSINNLAVGVSDAHHVNLASNFAIR
jgi:hypothetical protein